MSSQVIHSVNYHQVQLFFNGYENTTVTGQVITYPVAFFDPPAAIGSCPAGLVLSNVAQVTLPASMGATFTGTCQLVGY